MKVIGLTGGVGSGKSTVMDVLEDRFGAGIIIADEIGHEAMEKTSPVFDDIVAEFGAEILDSDGEINRNALANILFSSKEMLAKQNAIIHPYVNDRIRELLDKYKNEGCTLVVIESAILFEAGCDSFCDEVWCVRTSKETRIERLMRSRGYTREKSELIISNQPDDEEYEKRCSFILLNDGGIDELYRQIEERLR